MLLLTNGVHVSFGDYPPVMRSRASGRMQIMGRCLARRHHGEVPVKKRASSPPWGRQRRGYSGEVGSVAVLRRLVLHRRGRRVLAALLPRSGALHRCGLAPAFRRRARPFRRRGRLGRGRGSVRPLGSLRGKGRSHGQQRRAVAGEQRRRRGAAARGRQDARNTMGGPDCKSFQTSKGFSVNLN